MIFFILLFLFFFFFFFQAEDGIRDLTVTGVQTCALPISHYSKSAYKCTNCGNWHLSCKSTHLCYTSCTNLRSEEHTLNSSHSQISYAVLCLTKKKSVSDSWLWPSS